MKHLPLFAILVLAFGLVACHSASSQSTSSAETIVCEAPSADHYLAVDSVRHLIHVRHTEGSHCVVKLYEKSTDSAPLEWRLVLACEGNVGKNGMGKEKEGDNRTPLGDFGIITAFGIKPNPGTSLPYIDVKEDTYACGDEVAYNKIISLSELPHDCNGEHMIAYEPEYNYGFFPDYNKDCVLGKGSAIFFHCTGAKPYTAGCIAIPESDMAALLTRIDINARLLVE